jgi:hypothetical protein
MRPSGANLTAHSAPSPHSRPLSQKGEPSHRRPLQAGRGAGKMPALPGRTPHPQPLSQRERDDTQPNCGSPGAQHDAGKMPALPGRTPHPRPFSQGERDELGNQRTR